MKSVYLDYAASTPIDPRVSRAMRRGELLFGNPGSLHENGQAASAAIFKARRSLAARIGADYKEIIFTGSATEANNLALRGAVKAFRDQSFAANRPPSQIIVSAIEHESVLETARALEREGVEAVFCPVSRSGLVDLKKLKDLLNENTILVSIGYANNEIGVIQDIPKISRIVKDFRNVRNGQSARSVIAAKKNTGPRAITTNITIRAATTSYPLFHTDAVQAFQYLDCDVKRLGINLMTLSAHKIYGPKGIGALYVQGGDLRTVARSPVRALEPMITGGDQEGGYRSGTENTAAILGFSEAVRIAVARREKEKERLLTLRDFFWTNLKRAIPGLKLNGGLSNRLPNNLNVYFPKMSGAELLARFDLLGVSASAGSACRARQVTPSYVVQALGYSPVRAGHSLRFSLGRATKKSDLRYVIQILKTLFRL